MIGLSYVGEMKMIEQDDFPPKDWQPSEEILQRMKNEPIIDYDLHLGSKEDEKRGLIYLEQCERDRVEFPMFELYGPPCQDMTCKGVLTQYIQYIAPFDCWKQCSICEKQFERKPAIQVLKEA